MQTGKTFILKNGQLQLVIEMAAFVILIINGGKT